MRFPLSLLFVILALPAPVASAPPPAVQQENLKALLEEPGNTGMTVKMNRARGIPAFVQRGKAPLARAGNDHGSRAGVALDFLHRHKALYRLQDPGAELLVAKATTDNYGQHHYVLRQHVQGVPIRGAEARAYFTSDDKMRLLITRTVATPLNVNAAPAITSADAAAIARGRLGEMQGEQRDSVLEFRDLNGQWRLVYAVDSEVNGVDRWQTIVDAHSGEVLSHHLHHHDNQSSASGVDVLGNTRAFNAWREQDRFHLVDIATPVITGDEKPLRTRSSYGDTYIVDFQNTRSDTFTNASSSQPDDGWDPVAVSAMANVQRAYRYFRKTHGYRSLDGNNANLLVGIHYDEAYDNAFWNGKWLVFGDGDRVFTNLAGCEDVVGHEFAHGVIQYTAGLLYENQSGALNESLADVFGTLIERRNWVVGEDCTAVRPGYLRNMQDPHRGLASQPKHMSEYVELPNTKDGDWGGVHVNSGIPNRAAWLLVQGLDEEGAGRSIGPVRAEQLYFRALSTYLVTSAQFIDLRRALLFAAEDLYPGETTVKAAVAAAFDAVGIVEDEITGTDERIAGRLEATDKLDFGEMSPGTSRSRTLRLTNTGTSEVMIHAITVSKGFSHSITATRAAPGETVSGTVTFDALEAGEVSGELEVKSDSLDAPTRIVLQASVRAGTSLDDEVQNAGGGGGALSGLLLVLLLLPKVRRF